MSRELNTMYSAVAERGTEIAMALIGLIGGIFPAVRATRMPVAAALRAT